MPLEAHHLPHIRAYQLSIFLASGNILVTDVGIICTAGNLHCMVDLERGDRVDRDGEIHGTPGWVRRGSSCGERRRVFIAVALHKPHLLARERPRGEAPVLRLHTAPGGGSHQPRV